MVMTVFRFEAFLPVQDAEKILLQVVQKGNLEPITTTTATINAGLDLTLIH